MKTSSLKYILTKRHLIIKALREWFCQRGFIEVQTPVTCRDPIPEANIDLFQIKNRKSDCYLLPSPERYMKPLLSQGIKRFFQICPAFRRDEKGDYHRPEFTILEWYRADTNYNSLIEDCQSLIADGCKAITGHEELNIIRNGMTIDLNPPFTVITVREAFRKFAGWDPLTNRNEARFYHDMVTKVEPGLAGEKPVFLKDYPAWASSLSRIKKDDREVCERVEFYAGGMEIANGFSELLDSEEQRKRFNEENRKRQALGKNPVPEPSEFLAAMNDSPSRAAGMAMGIDRLVMLLTGSSNIAQVNAHCSGLE